MKYKQKCNLKDRFFFVDNALHTKGDVLSKRCSVWGFIPEKKLVIKKIFVYDTKKK